MPKLCVILGDGIGLEVIPSAVKILKAVVPDLETIKAEAGWRCFEKLGTSVPNSILDIVSECGAALFGAVSSPSYKVEGYKSAIISLRQQLDLYANIRPIRSWEDFSPRSDVDMIIVRENTEGLYIGRERKETKDTAIAERVITRAASKRIAEKALRLAKSLERERITIVHKANVLPISDGLFRDTVLEVINKQTEDHTILEVNELLVDVAAYKIISDPTSFDLIITTNMFGDILSDLSAYWCGGLALAPSLNMGDNIMIAEPVHGSAPDIAGKGLANPIAAILSAALIARYSWGFHEKANKIEMAVGSVLKNKSLVNINIDVTNKITQAILGELK
jgi:homoisocitrate dehydrogenase